MKTSTFFAPVALALGLLSAGAVQAQKTVELNLGHVLTLESHYHAAAASFAKEVEERSKGTMKVNVFPAGQLGGEVKMIQAVRTGTQDLVITGGGPIENTVKEFSVYSFPYLYNSLEQANDSMQGPIGKEMLELMGKYNLLGLGFIAPIERNIFTNGKRITKASDMKGLKIRVIQGQGFVKTYEALGAQPTPMAYAELYTALQNGAVDAAENSPDVFVQDKFIEVSKTYTMAKVMYMPALILMSPARYKSLTEEQQKVIQEATAAAVDAAFDHYKKGYAESMKIIKDKGIEIIEPDLDSFHATKEGVHKSLLESMPQTKAWYDKIVAETASK
jgi:tripartite ATP-independent transporter DctP family solute receptor